MQKNILSAIFFVALIFFISTKDTNAQSETPKFEIGGHYSMMTNVSFGKFFGASAFNTQFNPGIGGRVTFNLTRNIALETEMNFFPRDSRDVGRKYQWLYGLKLGVRKNKFGIFGKVRPGYLYLSSDFCGGFCGKPGFTEFIGGYRKNPLVDVGGVIEFYSSRRTTIRIDVGDTIVHFGALTKLESDVNVSKSLAGKTTHGLQINVGFGFRF